MNIFPEIKIAKLLTKKRLTLAIAESCTGGLISHRITNISGSSKYFDRGIVSYSNQSKVKELRVPRELIVKYGAVSKQVAKAMAEGVRKISKTDIGLSTTGIAGPTGATYKKPIGLVYIGVALKNKTITKRCIFKGTRFQIKKQAGNAALELLFNIIQ